MWLVVAGLLALFNLVLVVWGVTQRDLASAIGGYDFSGSFFVSGTSEDLQSNNIDDELRALGLVSTSSVKSNWEVNPAFGGPVIRDRLWFFASGRTSAVNNYIANSVANANAGDRNSFAFVPDASYRGSRDTLWQNVNARFTWQVNAKNKVSLFVDAQDRCSCIDSRALTSREASADFRLAFAISVATSAASTSVAATSWRSKSARLRFSFVSASSS